MGTHLIDLERGRPARGLVVCVRMQIETLLLRDVGPFDDVRIEFPVGTDPGLADVYLLTGPNGTGKSTILYALASVIGGGASSGRGLAKLGADLLGPRMRSTEAL